jgi:nitrogenase-associated protein
MADVVFYEKPGCINNTRQKRLLQGSGHTVMAHNLLYAPWTSTRLLAFFQDLPVTDWFNRSAPQITSGKLDPQAITKNEALYRMLADPILIRRPLMEVQGRKIVGFDAGFIDELIGLKDADEMNEDLESCPRV